MSVGSGDYMVKIGCIHQLIHDSEQCFGVTRRFSNFPLTTRELCSIDHFVDFVILLLEYLSMYLQSGRIPFVFELFFLFYAEQWPHVMLSNGLCESIQL